MFLWQTTGRYRQCHPSIADPSPVFLAEDLAVAAEAQPVRSPRPIVPRANDSRGGSAGAGVRPWLISPLCTSA